MEIFTIVIRHRGEPLDSPTATICPLPDGTTADQASEILHGYFSKYADDDIFVELWKNSVVVH